MSMKWGVFLFYSDLIVSKAVATDFEVVRPGSGCGLYNVGVVCLM